MKKSINNIKDLEEIFARINKLNPETKGLWGKMNVKQMMRHVSTAAGFAFAEKEPEPKPGFFSRTFVKWMILNIPAPKNSKTLPALNMVALKINPDNFELEKNTLKDIFKKISDSNGPFTTNPFLGDLTKDEWGKVCFVHANYHLKQFGV